jgi:thiamine transport system substrate-binding protein
MYPAGKASVPDAFGDLITPAKSLLFAPEQVAQNKSAWVAEWQGALSQ